MAESVLHELNDLVPRNGEPIDDWLAIENDELRQQLEDMELTVAIEHDIMLTARKENEKAQVELAQYKRQWSDVQREENKRLTKKVLLLTSILSEYENLLDQYVHSTSVKLTNNRLNQLLQEGGFKV